MAQEREGKVVPTIEKRKKKVRGKGSVQNGDRQGEGLCFFFRNKSVRGFFSAFMLSKKICITFSRAINPTRSFQPFFQFCFQSFLGSPLSVLFLYSPHRQPPRRTTHLGDARTPARYHSAVADSD